jgi:hypothetical protein
MRAWKLLCWGSLASADAGCVARLLATGAPRRAFAWTLVAHAAVALLAALLATRLGPPLARRRPLALASLAAALVFFLPVFGVVAVGGLAALGLGVRTARPADPWLQLDPERDAGTKAGPRSRIGPLSSSVRDPPPGGRRADASAASIAAVLRDRSAHSADHRFLALLRVRYLPDRAAVTLLKQALKDPSDEVRLFAFTRIERWRDELERSAKEFLAALETCDPVERGVLHMRVAEMCWEVAYLGLAEGAVLEHTLHRALEHAEEAAGTRREHGPADFLRGRTLLALGRHPEAAKAFAAAVRSGYPPHKVLPYAAEVAFRLRQFDRVRSTLRELELLARGHAAMQPIVGFWR